MKLFVGLGNPGKTFLNNRHNIGFNLIDKILDFLSENQKVVWNNKFNCHYFILNVKSNKIIFVKPQTFMNLSGNSIILISKFFKISNEKIFVFHDELDLPLGKIKLKFNGSHAGHNGIKSIHNLIGSNYFRIRIGIDHPGKKELVSSYVLSDFSKKEENILESSVLNFLKNINLLIEGNLEEFQKKI